MPNASAWTMLGEIASGRARANWLWKTAAAVGPPVLAFVVQNYVLHATMARWALFYPAVFVASLLGGLESGLVATAISTALVPIFFMEGSNVDFDSPQNLISIGIFITMGIAISCVHQRLRTIMIELERSRQWLQAIMDNSPNVIVIKDFTGRYLMGNRRLEELMHIAPGEVTGKTDPMIFPPENAELHRQTDADVFAKRHAITYEETLEVHGEKRTFLTSKFPLINGKPYPFAVCAIWSDITDRKRMEEALRQSEADLRHAERVAHLGSWTWNPADDTSRWSEELYRIMGIDPPAQGVDAPVTGAARDLPRETVSAIRSALETVLRTGEPYETELEIKRPDGSTFWVAARGDAVRNEEGKIVSVAGTAQDITELKQLQRQRDEWTSLIAHDLRQPIGVITMAASALPEVHKVAPEKGHELIKRISSAADGLARLVDDLLDLSLLEARRLTLDRQWVKPHALVTEAVERLSHLTNGRRVNIRKPDDLPEVFVDQMRLGQVLGNLISNAVKYGDKGSDIDVCLELHGTEVDIAVENRGPGIPPDEIEHLFERFTRTAKARRSGVRGLGVGLYIARELVVAHQGRIWVESTPGETTTFHVALPSRAAEQNEMVA